MDRPLDRIDARILTLLQQDGRMSNKALAAEVGLAPSSCLERVRRLSDEGVIRGTRALVDPDRVGVKLQAMVAIRLRSHDKAAWESLKTLLEAREEVVAIFHVSGADDLLVHVACRGTEHLRTVVLDAVSAHEAVQNVNTSLVFEQMGRSLPVYA